MDQPTLNLELANLEPDGGGAVECLGMTFANDGERRAYFLERLRERLLDPEFRKIEGFPIGTDEDILALSDPPYYTACPNPWIADFIRNYGKPYDAQTDAYHREPFAADVSEGKNDPLYKVPSYYTKVPPRAIQEYLMHYTEPGDLVLDAFCGSGMTGVATLTLDAAIRDRFGDSARTGHRNVILVDLSPLATFTSSIMNSPLIGELAAGDKHGQVAEIVKKDLLPLYRSEWDNKGIVTFDYAVWSDWGECSECGATFRLYDETVSYEEEKMLTTYPCPKCGAELDSRSQRKQFVTEFDPWVGEAVRLARTTLVLLSKKFGNRAVRHDASRADQQLAEQVGQRAVNRRPKELTYSHMTHERNNLPEYWGIRYIHQFYTRRNYYAIDHLLAATTGDSLKAALFAVLTILENNATRRNRFYVDSRRPHGSPVGPLSNTLYVPTVQVETNIGEKILAVLKDTASMRNRWPTRRALVSTQSATALVGIPDNSVDFVFTDPPFGGNINYSEQSVLGEWWIGVSTNNATEAITNVVQKKGVPEYQNLMTQCFSEYFRVLKPGRWMVVEFHNSSNAIWATIQQALEVSGFVVASVAMLDKVHSTLHQDHKAAAVDKDLAITVYKPSNILEVRFQKCAGKEEGVWDFVRTHLGQLPVFLSKDSQALMIAERQNYMLFDRMVAFHVQRGVPVPISAGDFYAGLAQRFAERDGMFFLPDQVVEYDRKRMTATEIKQLDLFVTDEASAIRWLRQQLSIKPQTFQELHPQFLREIGGWEKHEEALELSGLLEENFLRYDGRETVPAPIHTYLSTNWKELRNLPKDDPALRQKGKDRWYVPDPNKSGDLEKLRERGLLREFDQYKERRKKFGRNERFRMEAVRAGFKKAWQDRDYETIIAVAELIPESILQEDPKLLMWYDQAVTRSQV